MSTSPVRGRVLLGALLAVGVLLIGAAACSDDGESASPTTTNPDRSTTAPSDGSEGGSSSTTTSEGSPNSTTSGGSVPGSSTPVVTPAMVQRELRTLMADYRRAIAAAKGSGSFDETYDRIMTQVFTSRSAQSQTRGLQTFGGVAALRQPPGTPQVGQARIRTAATSCVSVTATLRLDPLVTKPLPGKQPASIRLVPASKDAPGSAWRIDYLDYSPSGTFDPGASC